MYTIYVPEHNIGYQEAGEDMLFLTAVQYADGQSQFVLVISRSEEEARIRASMEGELLFINSFRLLMEQVAKGSEERARTGHDPI